MNYIVFDTETTGLGSTSEVIQFSGLLLDHNLKLSKLINFYCYTQEPIEAEAAKIHGLTASFLMKQSGGKTFEDYFFELAPKEKDLIWVGYNTKFDIAVINRTLEQNGLAKYDFGKPTALLNKKFGIYNFDLMPIFASPSGYNQRLSTVAKQLPYSEEKLASMYQKLLNLAGLQTDVTYHNAIYDALVTWLLLGNFRQLCY